MAFIPWPTALLAQHLRDTGANEHLAAGTFLVMGWSFFAVWWHPRSAGLLERDLDPAATQRLVWRNVTGQLAYGGSLSASPG